MLGAGLQYVSRVLRGPLCEEHEAVRMLVRVPVKKLCSKGPHTVDQRTVPICIKANSVPHHLRTDYSSSFYLAGNSFHGVLPSNSVGFRVDAAVRPAFALCLWNSTLEEAAPISTSLVFSNEEQRRNQQNSC